MDGIPRFFSDVSAFMRAAGERLSASGVAITGFTTRAAKAYFTFVFWVSVAVAGASVLTFIGAAGINVWLHSHVTNVIALWIWVALTLVMLVVLTPLHILRIQLQKLELYRRAERPLAKTVFWGFCVTPLALALPFWNSAKGTLFFAWGCIALLVADLITDWSGRHPRIISMIMWVRIAVLIAGGTGLILFPRTSASLANVGIDSRFSRVIERNWSGRYVQLERIEPDEFLREQRRFEAGTGETLMLCGLQRYACYRIPSELIGDPRAYFDPETGTSLVLLTPELLPRMIALAQAAVPTPRPTTLPIIPITPTPAAPAAVELPTPQGTAALHTRSIPREHRRPDTAEAATTPEPRQIQEPVVVVLRPDQLHREQFSELLHGRYTVTASGTLCWSTLEPCAGPDGAEWSPRLAGLQPDRFRLPDGRFGSILFAVNGGQYQPYEIGKPLDIPEGGTITVAVNIARGTTEQFWGKGFSVTFSPQDR